MDVAQMNERQSLEPRPVAITWAAIASFKHSGFYTLLSHYDIMNMIGKTL
jgi:hypothetical protein